MAEPFLSVEDLSIAWRGADGREATVVDRVSFTLEEGASLGIAGESGSGKSTLARALLGWCRRGSRISGGRIRLAGHEITAHDPARMSALRGRLVAMVPQNPLASLTHHMRVGAQIEEVLRSRAGLDAAAARARALALMEETGLPDPPSLARRYPHQLSGGQRQRVVIAAALAADPALLVLDEPTTALDKTTEAQVLELIQRLRQARNQALVLVTHDLNVVADICHDVMVMQHGRVVERGPVRRVFAAPREPYTQALLAAALRVEEASRAADAPSRAPLLALQGVGFRYARPALFARRRAEGPPTLADITLSVGRGEVLGIIGESGSGKTTLGNLVTGLAAAQAGTIQFDGAALAGAVAARSAEARRRIQMVFQDPLSSLNPRRTVEGAITRPMRRFFGLSARAARARAAALLEELGMEPALLARFPRQLSGGQQQRVAIARAFAAEPDLLICDEITSALDASVQAQVLARLHAMQQRAGTAMLLITHDLAVVWRMAPRVVVMQAGRIIEAGPTERLFRAPADPYTARLVAAATRAARAAAPADTAAPRDPVPAA